MAAITLKQALEIIETGEYLSSLRFITADVRLGSGGKVIEFTRCRLAKSRPTNNAKPVTHVSDKIRRNPRHSYHFTLNMELQNKEIRKVHPILITHVNNMPVI